MGEPLAGLAPIETAQEATQEALQVIKEIPKNLVLGAELVCPCGSSHSYLNLETEEIEIGNLPQATVKDCRPKDNIQPFGTCWQGFFSIPHSCEMMMDLAEEWENPEPQTMLLNGEEVITTKSTLVCYASGREIYAVSSGQGGDNRFAKQQKLYLDVEKDYPGLLARLTDPHGSLYLEGGKYREAIGFLKDYLDERGGEVFLPGIYDMKEPEDVLVVAILDRLLTDCDASSYERLISGLENTGAQTGMYDKQGWDVYTLNQKMLYMLSIDSQATAEKMETSSFARWVEGHKKFMGILGDVVTEVAYGAVLYRCQIAKAVSKPKGEGSSKSKIGDFINLEGSTVDDILDRIPDETTLRELYPVEGGATEGFEFKWVQDGQTYRVRVHNADPGAPAGSNAANGWLLRIQRGTQYYDYTINEFQPAKFTNPKGPFF